MANFTDRQKKALGIFQFVLELILGLFKAHHAKDLATHDHHAKNLEPTVPAASHPDAE